MIGNCYYVSVENLTHIGRFGGSRFGSLSAQRYRDAFQITMADIITFLAKIINSPPNFLYLGGIHDITRSIMDDHLNEVPQKKQIRREENARKTRKYEAT